MNTNKLAAANELSGRINKVAKVVNQLAPDRISVIICPNKSTTPIMTIGCADDSEHEIARMARDFLDNVRAHYAAKLETLNAEFEAL